jgi:hypothetical protein
MTVPTITALPAAPIRGEDKVTFASKSNAFVGALATFGTEMNASIAQINIDVAAAAQSASTAAALTGATKWVSGSFVDGDARWSPIDRQTYRKIGASGGTTDPSIDVANWAQLTSGGAARVSSTTSVTSPLAWNSNLFDTTIITAQAGALTINADLGSPYGGKRHLFIFKDNGTARALTFTTGSTKSFRGMGRAIPTTTVISKWLYVGCVYNATAERWDVISVARES